MPGILRAQVAIYAVGGRKYEDRNASTIKNNLANANTIATSVRGQKLNRNSTSFQESDLVRSSETSHDKRAMIINKATGIITIANPESRHIKRSPLVGKSNPQATRWHAPKTASVNKVPTSWLSEWLGVLGIDIK
jgi:hypothetical protein